MLSKDDFNIKLQDISVLCVDDEEVSLKLMTRIIQGQVREVFSASDGVEGLYSYTRFNPDLVIADVEMPRMNGLEMAAAIREINPDSIIMVSTALDNPDYLKRAISLRLDEFISKPLVPDEVTNALNRGIEQINIKNQHSRYRKFTKLMLGGMPFPVMLVNTGQHRVEIVNPVARELGFDQGTSLDGPFFTKEILRLMHEKVMPSKLFKTPKKQVESIDCFGKSWDIYLNLVGQNRFIFVAVDVTWRKELEQLKDEVENITRHDMKTPLNGIIAIPDILLDSPNLSEEERELVGYIEEAGHTLLNMINLSLDLYKMEQGLYTPEPVRVDVARVARQVLKQLQPIVSGKKLSLSIFLNDTLMGDTEIFPVLGEELLCYSMLANLIKNALEASPAEGEINIFLNKIQQEAGIKIHNMGVVPEEIQEKFFDKLVTAGKSSGTGLGTYSAQLMAHTQNGRIEMETSEEKGTYVTVYLPAA